MTINVLFLAEITICWLTGWLEWYDIVEIGFNDFFIFLRMEKHVIVELGDNRCVIFGWNYNMLIDRCFGWCLSVENGFNDFFVFRVEKHDIVQSFDDFLDFWVRKLVVEELCDDQYVVFGWNLSILINRMHWMVWYCCKQFGWFFVCFGLKNILLWFCEKINVSFLGEIRVVG